MKTIISLSKHICKSMIFLLLAVFLFLNISCEKKLEESPLPSERSDRIIVKKDEPVIKNKSPVYSYPPNVASTEAGKYSQDEIEKMATELNMKGFNEGNKRYYKNSKHMIFNPDQIPTIFEHKKEYFEEIDTLW